MFYTYMWLREDGSPYYIGKGTGSRAWRRGSPPPERIIVQEWTSEAEACQAEIFLIAFYGRKDRGTGILRNFTDGGEGTSGREWTPEQRRKFQKSAGRAWKSRIENNGGNPKATAKLTAFSKGRSKTPIEKLNMSKAAIQSWTPTRKAAQAKRARAQSIARFQARNSR